MTLIKPQISEYSLKLAQGGRFSFVVERDANKPQIQKAIERVFGVEVTDIRTAVIPAKTYRVGKARMERRTTRGKKAIVMLKEGQKIDLFEFSPEEDHKGHDHD
jgi:large subunit ribosomal protein L23